MKKTIAVCDMCSKEMPYASVGDKENNSIVIFGMNHSEVMGDKEPSFLFGIYKGERLMRREATMDFCGPECLHNYYKAKFG